MAWLHQKYYNYRPKLVPGLQPSPDVLKRFRYVFNDYRIIGRVARKLYRIVMAFQPLHNEPIEL